VFPRGALINVHAFEPIPVIPVGTATGIASGKVFALCEIVTLVLQIITFVYIHADFAIALVSRLALASISALGVDAKSALVAIVRSGGAFVNVGTQFPVSLVSVVAGALEAAGRVDARRQGGASMDVSF
jgi:hypothetical protein